MPKESLIDPRHVSAGLAAIGLVALAAAGVITFTTPGEEQCKADLSDTKVALADAKARLELLTEVKDSCKEALHVCVKEGP